MHHEQEDLSCRNGIEEATLIMQLQLMHHEQEDLSCRNGIEEPQ
jgi:hypothetical protein